MLSCTERCSFLNDTCAAANPDRLPDLHVASQRGSGRTRRFASIEAITVEKTEQAHSVVCRGSRIASHARAGNHNPGDDGCPLRCRGRSVFARQQALVGHCLNASPWCQKSKASYFLCRQIYLTREFFSNTFTCAHATLWLKVILVRIHYICMSSMMSHV